jgi:hypothetical protein
MAESTVDPNGVCEVLAKMGRPALIVDRQGQVMAANELTAKLLGPDLQVVNGRLIRSAFHKTGAHRQGSASLPNDYPAEVGRLIGRDRNSVSKNPSH